MKSNKKSRFFSWLDGEQDLYTGNVEMKPQKEYTLPPQTIVERMREQQMIVERVNDVEHNKEYRLFKYLYRILSGVFCVLLIGVLLSAVSYLPPVGNAANPDNNEVSARYIEKGLDETGAVNIVTGMILDYRAFDTLGESHVLFIATVTVLVLMRKNKGQKEDNDRIYEPKNDTILQKAAFILVPMIMIFGIYVILNGHLSPGGGFSGGAIMGAGLILYLNAFGFEKTERFFTEKTYKRVCFCSLSFYCLAKSYSFYTGANGLHSGIPLGTPGAILSSGLILPLNICVGLVVACTMYAFYALFRKGGF
ncbi:MAG: hydrogen gas-evolving membrane-bound hydrogenase subunit E [Lachnospiraceae bacterium]|nr:hydrogen gas-evolving membrane-bound hydrogenase subunit E [Lachnospiraceae bacterium]